MEFRKPTYEEYENCVAAISVLATKGANNGLPGIPREMCTLIVAICKDLQPPDGVEKGAI